MIFGYNSPIIAMDNIYHCNYRAIVHVSFVGQLHSNCPHDFWYSGKFRLFASGEKLVASTGFDP